MASRAFFPPNDPGSNGVKIGAIDVDPKRVIIRVRGLKTGINVDVKEAAGISLASITYQGRKLATWTLEFRGAHGGRDAGDVEESFAMLVQFAKIAFAASGAQTKTTTSGNTTTTARSATPVAITHQMLAMAGVTAMVVTDLEWPEEQDDKSYAMTWTCIQYAPPLKVNVSKPLQGDVLNPVDSTLGNAPPSTTSPQLPQPPSAVKAKP